MTAGNAEPRPPGPLALILRGARTRILAAFVILMAFSTLLSVLAIRQLLIVRTADRVDAALIQEVNEFRTLVRGINPGDGKPFAGRVHLIFDTYFDRNVPAVGETLIAYLDGRRYDDKSTGRGGTFPIEEYDARWASLRRSERGTIETSVGSIRYLAVPINGARGLR